MNAEAVFGACRAMNRLISRRSSRAWRVQEMLRLVIEELIHDGVVVHDVADIRFPDSSLDFAQEVESVDRFINRHIVRQGMDDREDLVL